MKNTGKILIGFLAGAAAGVAAVYLLSPKVREEAINEIKDMADKIKAKINEELEKAKEAAENMKNEAADL